MGGGATTDHLITNDLGPVGGINRTLQRNGHTGVTRGNRHKH